MDLPARAPTSIQDGDIVTSLLPKAIEILQRDFELSNITCNLSSCDNVFSLRDQLIPIIEQTGGPGSEAFYRLLYRVDVPESKVADVMQVSSDQPIMARISELLIIRALQKAWYRAKFT